MSRPFAVAAVAAVLCLCGSTVLAQCGCGSGGLTYAPVVPSYTTYYAPAVTTYSPTVTYYPSTVTTVAPTVAYYPSAVTTVAPTVTYYPSTSYVAYYPPVATPVTYYSPVVRPYAAYYGTPGWSVFGTPKIYAPDQPVLNTIRALTP